MSTTHSAEFKAKVALEAVSLTNEIIAEVAKKYDLTEDEVRSWASELKNQAATVFSSSKGDVSDVEIESEDISFIQSVQHGVQEDALNYKKLIFWSGLGIGIVAVFVVSLIYFAQFSFFNATDNAGPTSSYLEVEKLMEDQNAQLNSYGVVDLEKGIYHIPIDEAINQLAID